MKYLANPYASFMTSRAHYKIEGHMNSSRSVEVGPIIVLSETTTAVDIPAATDAHPELDIAAHICLCRDKCRTVRLKLRPRSIMILGQETLAAHCRNRLASVAKKRWASGDLRGIEVGDHAGFGLRPYRDIVVRCLLGCY